MCLVFRGGSQRHDIGGPLVFGFWGFIGSTPRRFEEGAGRARNVRDEIAYFQPVLGSVEICCYLSVQRKMIELENNTMMGASCTVWPVLGRINRVEMPRLRLLKATVIYFWEP